MNIKKVGRPKANPKLGKVPINLRLPFWLVQWLRDSDTAQSVLIENALIKHYKLKAPIVSDTEGQQ
jgi:hypothetical protein